MKRIAAGRAIAWIVIAVLALTLLATAVYALMPKPADPLAEVQANSEAARKMVEQVAATSDGASVDLAQALPVPWDRAVLIEPYADGKAMNATLGFDAFPADATGPQDEANQLVVFVRGSSVVASVGLFPEAGSFRFGPSIAEFLRDASVFVARRDGDCVTLARP